MTDLISMFNELDDFFPFVVNRPVTVRYNCGGTKDLTPAHFTRWMVKGEDDKEEFKGYRCIVRTVGIAPDDVSITCGDNGIIVQGETEYEGNKFTQYVELPIARDVMRTIKKVNYSVQNGLTHIYLEVKPSESSRIPIERK